MAAGQVKSHKQLSEFRIKIVFVLEFIWQGVYLTTQLLQMWLDFTESRPQRLGTLCISLI